MINNRKCPSRDVLNFPFVTAAALGGFNPLVLRVQEIKIRKLALTDFYWLNL